MLQIIKQLVDDRIPLRIIFDFEIGFITAFNEVFPGVIEQGCYFHFRKCIWQHVQEVGLKERYSENINLSMPVKMFAALAFLPVEDVIYAYE